MQELIVKEKKCKKCKIVKNVVEFGVAKSFRDGFMRNCKICQKAHNREYREANKEKLKEYLEANKEHIAKRSKRYKEANNEAIVAYRKAHYVANKEYFEVKGKKYRKDNKEYFIAKGRKYREDNKEYFVLKGKEYRENNKEYSAIQIKKWRKDNKDKIKAYSKEYYKANKENKLKYSLKYIKARRKTDNLYRLKANIRKAVYKHLKGAKSKKTTEIVGMDFKDFQTYLVKEYKEDMHLDHIIPQSWANNDKEVYVINHYSNFQIITAKENMSKSNTFCKSENLKKVLNNHNDLATINKIIERNYDRIM